MKYLLWFLGIFVCLLGCAYFLAFSNIGNQIMKPYLQNMIQKSVQNKVEISSFTLKPNFIDVEILLDEKSKVVLNGDLSLFDLGFNVDYMLALKDIKTNYGNLEGIAAFKGNIIGNKDDFNVKGEGEIFDAKTNLSLHVKNKKPTAINIHSSGLHIEKILALLNQPIYSKGLVDVDANLKPTTGDKLTGAGKVNIHFGQLDAKVVENQFKLRIPQNVTYRGDIAFNLEADKVIAQSSVVSNLLKIDTTKTIFMLDSQKLFSDFTLSIPNLSALKEIIGIDLFGNIQVQGDITKVADDLEINANSQMLGGAMSAKIQNDTASIKLSKMYVSELLKMLRQEAYSNGVLDSTIEISSLKNLDFQSLTNITDATFDANTLEKLLKKENVPEIPYTLEVKANGHDKLIEINSSFKSSFGNFDVSQTNYDIDKKLLYGKYTLHVNSLKKLSFLTRKELDAKFDTAGEFKYDKENFTLNGLSDFLDSKTQYSLNDTLFTLNANELAIEKITNMLHYPKVFESYSSAVLNYDLEKSEGNFTVQALNGKLTQSELTTLVGALLKFDIAQEIYTKGELKGLINHENIDFSALLNGLNSNFTLSEGKVNTKQESVYGKFNVKVKNKDVSGVIKGTLGSPKISINNSDYLKDKLDKQIDKHVPDEWKAPVKNLLKLFN